MAQPSSTERYADFRAALDAAEAADLPAPGMEFSWHGVSDDAAAAILRAFPDANWSAIAGGSSEWLSAQVGAARITVFLQSPPARPAERGKALLAGVRCACGRVNLPSREGDLDDGLAVHGHQVCDSHGEQTHRAKAAAGIGGAR